MEAAFVVPMAWFCTGILLAINFYVHNRVWYQAAAWEAVLAGNGREGQQEGAGPAALAGEKLEARLEEQIMPGELPGHWIREAGEGMEIRLTGQVFSLGSRKILEYEAAAEAQRVRPVSFLRKHRVLQMTAEIME